MKLRRFIIFLILLAFIWLIYIFTRKRDAIYVFSGENVLVFDKEYIRKLEKSRSSKDAFTVFSWYDALKDSENSVKWRKIWLERKAEENKSSKLEGK